MSLMDEETMKKVKETMATMVDPVHAVVYVEDGGCEYCKDTLEIVTELSSLSGKLTFESRGPDRGSEHGVDRYPAIVITKGTASENRYLGIRFFGIPAGYEFTSLLDAIMTVSKGDGMLSQEAKDYLGKLEKDIHLQVFVTPTCPYCPRAVVLAHHMALASDRVTADMVEATEFQDMSVKYQVMGVPKTIVNEHFSQEGAAPERMILDLIRKAAGPS